MTEERIQLAENLLQEAVFHARARQAAGVALGTPGGDPVAAGGCGLGEGVPGDLELSPRGERLFHELWPRDVAPTELDHVKGVLQDWVETQDAFDRKRNHYLRDFRQQHGFDRRAYTTEQASAFDAGLARINAEVDLRLREAAEKLLDH